MLPPVPGKKPAAEDPVKILSEELTKAGGNVN